MTKLVKGEVTLLNTDVERLQKALGVLPDDINGLPYVVTVRRREMDRRRVSLVKADFTLPGQSESQELYRLCKYKGAFVTIGFALRSMVSGDYYVFSERW